MLNALYNQVDEEVHKLVILSNKSQKELESLLEVRKFEEQTQQVSLCRCSRFYLCFLYCTIKCFTRAQSGPAASTYSWNPGF